MDKDIKYWFDLAIYDKGSAEAMYKSGRYLYVLFMCQQAIEKMLKGLVLAKTGKFPPRIHDLIKLTNITDIEFDQSKLDFLRELTQYYIQTRYPEDAEKISRMVNKEMAYSYLKETKELMKWLKVNLK